MVSHDECSYSYKLQHTRACRVFHDSVVAAAISQNHASRTARVINYSRESYRGPFENSLHRAIFFVDSRKARVTTRGHLVAARLSFRVPASRWGNSFSRSTLPSPSVLRPTGTSLLTKIKGLLTRTSNTRTREQAAKRASSKGTPRICTCSSSLPHRPCTLPSFL